MCRLLDKFWPHQEFLRALLRLPPSGCSFLDLLLDYEQVRLFILWTSFLSLDGLNLEFLLTDVTKSRSMVNTAHKMSFGTPMLRLKRCELQ